MVLCEQMWHCGGPDREWSRIQAPAQLRGVVLATHSLVTLYSKQARLHVHSKVVLRYASVFFFPFSRRFDQQVRDAWAATIDIFKVVPEGFKCQYCNVVSKSRKNLRKHINTVKKMA